MATYSTGGRGGETGVYTVDVQPLNAAGLPDGPVLPHLPIPTIWAGADRGVLAIPPVGAMVRVAWYESGEPYLDALLPDGFNLPAQAAGSLMIMHPAGRIQILPTGQIWIQSSEGITLTSDMVIIEGDLSVTGTIHP
ncbi:MAG: hypothetical protein ACOY94_19560 [Bacillota bacterium]